MKGQQLVFPDTRAPACEPLSNNKKSNRDCRNPTSIRSTYTKICSGLNPRSGWKLFLLYVYSLFGLVFGSMTGLWDRKITRTHLAHTIPSVELSIHTSIQSTSHLLFLTSSHPISMEVTFPMAKLSFSVIFFYLLVVVSHYCNHSYSHQVVEVCYLKQIPNL